MTNILSSCWRLVMRVRDLQRVMPVSDAIRLTLEEHRPGEGRTHLTAVNRHVVIRRTTTDLQCLEKVFLEREYKVPFDVSPRVIIDAGANVGMATLYFAAKYPQARIVAIEPESSNFEILCRNCGNLPNVSLIKAALWPYHGPLTIQNSNVQKWAFSVVEKDGLDGGEGSVAAITIPEILRQLSVDKIDLLKLDIEGAELELFACGSDVWLDHVRLLVIELHDRFRPGCAQALYTAINGRPFIQEIKGETIFIRFCDSCSFSPSRHTSQGSSYHTQ